nr:hypothetical protein [uncultured Prevotella sp.]
MGLRRHQPLITTPQRGDGARNGHLPSRHNMRCDHATTWDCAPHAHLSPHYNMGRDHITTWDRTPLTPRSRPVRRQT